MRGPACLLPLLAACSFAPAATGFDASTGGGGADADVTPGDDAAPPIDGAVDPDAPPQQVTCTTSDPDLRLCLEFEDPTPGTAVDGSGLGHDATVAAATPAVRDVPVTSNALGINVETAIRVGATADHALQTITIAGWVRRTATPSFEYGVIDIGDGQTQATIDEDGKAVCHVFDGFTPWFRPGGTVTLNEWDFIACTYDSPTICTYVFHGANPAPDVVCGNTDGFALDTSDTTGTTIGALPANDDDGLNSHLIGAVDAIRIYARALTAAELCASAGLTGC